MESANEFTTDSVSLLCVAEVAGVYNMIRQEHLSRGFTSRTTLSARSNTLHLALYILIYGVIAQRGEGDS
jgi:hypothetical protein